jgi:3-oxoacyl-[acyl-carrier protein] reductase
MLFDPDTVALITGASGGIGGTIAAELAHEGAAVVIHYHSSNGEVDEVAHPSRPPAGRRGRVKRTCRMLPPCVRWSA